MSYPQPSTHCLPRNPPGETYLEVLQIRRYGIRPYFVPLNDVSSKLGVPAHGPRPVTLVEAAANIFGRDLDVTVAAYREHLCRSHIGVAEKGLSGRPTEVECAQLARGWSSMRSFDSAVIVLVVNFWRR